MALHINCAEDWAAHFKPKAFSEATAGLGVNEATAMTLSELHATGLDKTAQNHVWTVDEDEDGTLFVIQGVHHHGQGFFVTEITCDKPNSAYPWGALTENYE